MRATAVTRRTERTVGVKRCGAALAVLLVWTGAGIARAADAPRVELSVGIHLVHAEVASTDAQRMRGLMQRRALPTNGGMIFVFAEPDRHCMWMRNTLVPLSVAFIDARGAILNIEDMRPQTDDAHCAARPAAYALEMARGWFAARGVRPGMHLSGIERLPPPR